MTETTTPSVEGDRLEAIKSLILAEFDCGGGCVDGPDWDWNYSEFAFLADKLARQIAALPCKGGDGLKAKLTAALAQFDQRKIDGVGLATIIDSLVTATPTTEPDTGRGLREALEALKAADEALTQFAAFEDDARYIMGNTNFEIVKQRRTQVRQALAALSDTPREREGEGKQGLMASRDLGPTTVASSLKGSDVGG